MGVREGMGGGYGRYGWGLWKVWVGVREGMSGVRKGMGGG